MMIYVKYIWQVVDEDTSDTEKLYLKINGSVGQRES